jgi:hypothetical protein
LWTNQGGVGEIAHSPSNRDLGASRNGPCATVRSGSSRKEGVVHDAEPALDVLEGVTREGPHVA